MQSKSKLKLEQGQIWKQGDEFLRIVKWSRVAIEYKKMTDPAAKDGTVHDVTKKEFCRLIKGATLMTPDLLAADQAARDAAPAPGEPALLAPLTEDGPLTLPVPETA